MNVIFMIAGLLVVSALASVAFGAAWHAADRRPRQPFNVEAMLDAIAAVESGNCPTVIGKFGERGRCQFLPSTWGRYTNAPFLAWAPVDCELTRRIEKAHLSYLVGYLIKQGFEPEPTLVAAAWRFGPGNAVRCIRADSAQRTANLYWANVAQGKAAR